MLSSSLSSAERLLAVLCREDDREEEPKPALAEWTAAGVSPLWSRMLAELDVESEEEAESNSDGSLSNRYAEALSISPRLLIRADLMAPWLYPGRASDIVLIIRGVMLGGEGSEKDDKGVSSCMKLLDASDSVISMSGCFEIFGRPVCGPSMFLIEE